MSVHRKAGDEAPVEKRVERLTGDEKRRNRFKERSKNLERGVSAPAFALNTPSDEPSPAPKAPLPLNAEEAVTVAHGMGHELVKKTFFQPTYCHHCTELLWGIKGQGLQCTVCNYVTHERCVPFLNVPCRHLMADKIQNPVAHKWTKPMSFKKKVHCNVCRRKIGSLGVICEVCKYYAHTSCKEKAFNGCKQCATYAKGANAEDQHHWIEGNLPGGARCQMCTKGCATTECLSGFRCGWCGITVHSGCLEAWQAKQPGCTYRQLWGMILIPKSVTHTHAIHSDLDPDTPHSPDDPDGDIEEEEAEEDKEEEEAKTKQCVVVDGRDKTGFKRWRKNTLHPTPISKSMTAAQLLSISLRKCGISDDPSEYFLAEMIDSSRGEERELDPAECPYNVKTKAYGLIRLYIRHKSNKEKVEEVKGNLRVNNSYLETPIRQVVVPTGVKTTAAQIVEQALVNFDLEAEIPTDYCLVELSQIYGVKERVLDDNECPWAHMQDLRRTSVTLSSRQRYSVRHRTGGETSLYLANVPKDILKDEVEYIKYVKELIAQTPQHLIPDNIPYDKITIGPAFPSMGGLILHFPNYVLAMKISACLEQSPSKPKVIMIPTIYNEVIGVDQEPLLVFVNGKSGGNQGLELLSAFRRHLNPHQVFDLANGGPIPGLLAFRNMGRFRILIGGGDGTFGWVLSALQEANDILQCRAPPCGLLPLGTGNDLARALNWGGGYTGTKVMQILLSLEDSNVVSLDRWEVCFKEVQLPKEAKETKSMDIEQSSVVMNNYVGVGLDAAIALDFHLAREENPEKFSSRFHNKGVYLQLGLQKMISKGDTKNLQNHINVFVDGRRVDMPDVEGIVFLNIQSWGAGADAWGTSPDPNFDPARCDDGKLELVGISGVIQMGQIQSGVRSGIRIAQGKEFKMDILSTIPVQVDGEAWPQPPCVMTISCLPDKASMLRGPDKSSVAFSRSLSKKEEQQRISLLHTISQPEILLSGGMSSRRGRSLHEEPRPTPEFEDSDDD